MKSFGDFKIIWEYIRKYKNRFYLISAFAIVNSLLLAIVPYFYGKLIDVATIDSSNLNIIALILSVWFVVGVSSVFFNTTVNKGAGYLGIDLYVDLIFKAFSHLLELPLAFHKEKKIGEIFSRIERAAHRLLEITEEILFWTVPQLITAVAGITILFFVRWELALGTAAIFIGYFVITIYNTNPIIKEQKNLNRSFEFSAGNFYDAILNAQSVKANTAEIFQQRKIKRDYSKTSLIFKRFFGLWYSLSLKQDIFSTFGFLAMFIVAIFMLRQEMISVGEVVMFFGYINLVFVPLRGLGWHWKSYKIGISTIKRVEKILKIKKEDYKEGGKILKDVQGRVEFKNVSFKYKGKGFIFEDISFSVLPGQKIAIVGESGEGKTTLIDLISLYFKPSKGKILIDGVNIRKINLRFLRKNIAYVPQEIILFNDTVKNNIRFGNPEAPEEKVIEAAKLANAHEFISKFPRKYNQIVGERGIKLSTGQKQRIAISRAILRDPKILILDEATSSLDSKTEKMVQQALEKLMKGRTSFIIAHRLSTIKSADRIIVIKKGKVAEEGTHQELIDRKGLYFDFHSLQFGQDS